MFQWGRSFFLNCPWGAPCVVMFVEFPSRRCRWGIVVVHSGKKLTLSWTRLQVCFNASFPISWFELEMVWRVCMTAVYAYKHRSLSVEQLSRQTFHLNIPTDSESLHEMEKRRLRLHKDERRGCAKNVAELWKHTSEAKTEFVLALSNLHTDTTDEWRMFSNSFLYKYLKLGKTGGDVLLLKNFLPCSLKCEPCATPERRNDTIRVKWMNHKHNRSSDQHVEVQINNFYPPGALKCCHVFCR